LIGERGIKEVEPAKPLAKKEKPIRVKIRRV